MLELNPNAVDITASLQDRILSLATHKGGGRYRDCVDIQKKYLLLAGVLAECLMDYNDPFHELRLMQHELLMPFARISKEEDENEIPCLGTDNLDQQLELGRALARLYLDDDEAASRVLKQAVIDIVAHDVRYAPFDIYTRYAQTAFFLRLVHLALAFEVTAHLFCDRVIEAKIAQDAWTVSDCLMAMSGLAGRYYAFAAIEEEEQFLLGGDGLVVDNMHNYSHKMLEMISAEALRMGVSEGGNLLGSIAANDTEYRAYPHLIYSLEPAFSMLADRYELESYAIKAIAVAKATGRMMAVACCGDEAEVEHSVAKPLTVASFIGSVHHFSPR